MTTISHMTPNATAAPEDVSRANARMYHGTIEHIRQGEAIVTLTDSCGEWCGSGLVQCRRGLRADLYELGYTAASRSAIGKGGRLETFREVVR